MFNVSVIDDDVRTALETHVKQRMAAPRAYTGNMYVWKEVETTTGRESRWLRREVSSNGMDRLWQKERTADTRFSGQRDADRAAAVNGGIPLTGRDIEKYKLDGDWMSLTKGLQL